MKAQLIGFVCMAIAVGCGGSPESEDAVPTASTTADAKDSASTATDADAQSSDGDAANDPTPSDTGSDATVEPDSVDGCAALCTPFADCETLSTARCVAECDSAFHFGCTTECFETSANCGDLMTCLGIAAPVATFSEGPYGTGMRDTAGTATLDTLDGPWAFETFFDGNDSYLFLTTADGYEYPVELWNSPIKFWLWETPPNVHLFFLSFEESTTAVEAVKENFESSLEKGFDADEACMWRKRVHFVTTPAHQIEGWIGTMLSQTGWFQFAVDRFQNIRPVGLLSTVQGSPQLSHLAYEADYFNFEWQRHQELSGIDATIVEAVSNQSIQHTIVDVEFPSAEEMAGFDTLQIELANYCEDHIDSNCAEWDVTSHMNVCEIPVAAENAHAETPCQSEVKAQDAVEEAMGTCGEEGAACAADTDCDEEGVACLGYVAPTEAVEGITADTMACACTGTMGEEVERQHVCNAEGTGYGECGCGCPDEVARWITTYSREGRWIHDASPFLAFFRRGGTVRVNLGLGNGYITTLAFRLSNSGKEDVSSELVKLYSGAPYGANYNDYFEPMTLTVPDDVKRVELVAHITGHGFGVEKANCAEFCNHTHHFFINGDEYAHDQPWVGDNFGCAKQIADGAVANQYGTWYLGRGGWCPGMDVKPFVADVTASILVGEENAIDYEGLFEGVAPYVPEPKPNPQSGFGGSIAMQSWLVYYR